LSLLNGEIKNTLGKSYFYIAIMIFFCYNYNNMAIDFYCRKTRFCGKNQIHKWTSLAALRCAWKNFF